MARPVAPDLPNTVPDSAPTTEQIVAAQQLLIAAKYTKDAEDESAFAEVWAHGARLIIETNGRQLPPLIGRAAILDFYRGNWRAAAHGSGAGREMHVAEPAHVTGLPNGRLLAQHNAIFAAMAGEEPVLIGFAQFHDELVFEEGSWRIITRHSTIKRRAKQP
jgi:hypothetical protein